MSEDEIDGLKIPDPMDEKADLRSWLLLGYLTGTLLAKGVISLEDWNRCVEQSKQATV